MSNWYANAARWVKRVKPHHMPMLTACRVVSAFSINCNWTGTQTQARAFFRHGRLPRHAQTRRQVRRALRGLPLTGPKIEAFAQALKGDRRAVVIDRWMLRYLGMPEGWRPRTQEGYDRLAWHLEVEANEAEMPPRDYQAGIWGVMRETLQACHERSDGDDG